MVPGKLAPKAEVGYVGNPVPRTLSLATPSLHCQKNLNINEKNANTDAQNMGSLHHDITVDGGT